jgi:carbohydrate kinase (thermoresistant glucokinase family)
MRNGIGLNDDLRLNWLIRLRQLLVEWFETKKNGILACSALKQKYRHLLNSNLLYVNCQNMNMIDKHDSTNLNLTFIMLDFERLIVENRLSQRANHDIIKNSDILDSQFDTLERPESNSIILKFKNSYLSKEVNMLNNNHSYLIYVYRTDEQDLDSVEIITDNLINFLKSNAKILNFEFFFI